MRYREVMFRKALAVTGAVLAGFHLWLLGSQLLDGRLADASVLLRWGVAAALAAALWSLRRQGVSIIWGRKAVTVWLLAAVLHGPALTDRIAGDGDAAASAAAVLVQVTGTLIVAAVLFAAILFAAARPRIAFASARVARRSPRLIFSLSGEPFAPRPPPV